jgi:hypothetical protein
MLKLKVALAAALFAIGLMLFPSIADARCPSGYVRRGNRCVRYGCPSGFFRDGNKCVRCRPGCYYVGNGKCRCRR